MYPDKKRPPVPSNGSTPAPSPDQKPAGNVLSPTPEESRHANVEDSTKEAKEHPNEGLTNTTHSATMTCPEQQCWNWPPIGMYPPYPYPYPPNGAYCYPPPPYILNPSSYNIPHQNCSLHPAYCSNVNNTPSGVNVSSVPQTHLNANAVNGSSNHGLMQNPNCYHAVPYTCPPIYPPNGNIFLPSLPVIPAGHILAPNQNVGMNPAQSRICLCGNCSRDIIPMVDESNVHEISNQTPLSITSFRDNMGRVWRCTSTKSRKASSSKDKELSGNSLAVGSFKPPTLNESLKKKSVLRASEASPSSELPLTSREDALLPLRKKRTKPRARKIAETLNVMKSIHRSPSRVQKPKPTTVTKSTKEIYHMNLPCLASNTTANSTANSMPTKEITSKVDESTSTKGDEQVSVPHNNAPVKKLHPAPTEKPDNKQEEVKNKPFGQKKDVPVPAGSTNEGTTKVAPPPPVVNSEVSGPSTSSKHTKGNEDEMTIEVCEQASCNDFLKKQRNRKDMSLPASQCAQELKEEEDFWSTSSSSSGTYDDSEAFDSFKLLNEVARNSEALRQIRQRSRDRLFRRKAVGFVKVTNAQSEEGLQKQRRAVSPRPKAGDEKTKEQIIVDTSQLRITEETPKRFIVESKDGATTSQNSMTITVQADMQRPNPRDVCDACRLGGQAGVDAACTCSLPPCQRPQWQAPPCPANEIHGTPVHHCHNMPNNGRLVQPPSHSQRHREFVHPRNQPDDGDISFMRDTVMMRELEAYHLRNRRANLGLVGPWNQRNADRPREENRHPHYIAPHPSSERVDVRREHCLPTNRTRRWHTQSEAAAETRSNRQAQAQEMLRIQIPNSFPRYRPYEYARNHNEEPIDNHEGVEESVENRPRGSIDINIFRNNGGMRRLGTIRRVLRSISPRERENPEEPNPQDEDPESNLDFYRRPRSAITVSKTNYFSPRNRKLEEEVQRIQSANYMPDVQSSSAAKEDDVEYPNKDCCDGEQEFEEVGKPDCEYEDVEERKRDPSSHRDAED